MENKTFFKNYKISLEVISPVHIGSGEEYIPTDYVIKNNKLFVINRAKFINKIENEGKYNDFLSVCDTGDILKIRKFIYDNFDVSLSGFQIEVTARIQNEYDKKLTIPAQIEKKENRKIINALEIRKCVYSNFKDEVIIPGSSIKGAIRTAVLDYFGKNKKKEFEIVKNKKYANQNLQKYLLNIKSKDNSDDPFRHIKISDFILQKEGSIIDSVQNVKKFGVQGKGVPVKMEIVKPTSIFQGIISIYKNSKFTIEDILNWCNLHYLEDTYNFEKDYFKYENSNLPKLNLEANTFYLKIGQHSGAFAVTLDTYRKGNIWHQKLRKNLDYQTTTWKTEHFNMPLGWIKCKILNEILKPNTKSLNKAGKKKTEITVIQKRKKADKADFKKLQEKWGKN